MNEPMARTDETTISVAAILVVAVFVAMILLPLLTMSFSHAGGMGGMGGMMGSDSGAFGFPLGTVLAIIGVVLIVVILLVGFVRRSPQEVTYVPQPEPAAPLTYSQSPSQTPWEAPAEPSSGPTPPEDFERWAMRLLEGDERLMFKDIVDKGGVALQKDLGVRFDFSRAKVTRILDKLEDKGLIVKERAGMTNRVRIVRGEVGD